MHRPAVSYTDTKSLERREPRSDTTLGSTTHNRKSIFFSVQFSYPIPLCDTTLDHTLHLILPNLVATSPSSMISPMSWVL